MPGVCSKRAVAGVVWARARERMFRTRSASPMRCRTNSYSSRGGPPKLWKLGAPTYAAQDALGLPEPFCGPMFEDVFHHSPARIDASALIVHLFEPEIAVLLATDLSCHDAVTPEEAKAAIASLHPAVEILNFRMDNTAELGPAAMISDYAANGGFVLGDACPADFDYWDMSLDVRINGAIIAERTPPAEETDPAALLAWTARHLGGRGYTLKAGDILTTGSQAGIVAYQPGDLLEADFGKAGIVRVQFLR